MICGFCQQGKHDKCPGDFTYFDREPGGRWWIERCRCPVLSTTVPMPKSRVESVLEEAHRLINGERNKAYGPPGEDYARTVAIFNAWTGHTLTVDDGIRFMRAVKMSREIASPTMRDNYVDAAGYLGCQAKVLGIDA